LVFDRVMMDTRILGAMDWRVLILPVGFVMLCVAWYGGIWFYRMRMRSGRMKRVVQAMGGTFTAGCDRRATESIPQFEGTQLRLARAAYNTVETEWVLHGRACRVWMGDAGNQFNRDPLVQAVGGDIVAGFIAVESPVAQVREAVFIHKDMRASEQVGRLRRMPWGRGGGAVVNLVEMLQDFAARRGLTRLKTGDAGVDRDYAIYADSVMSMSIMVNTASTSSLKGRWGGHLWIKDGVVLMESGDRVWSADEFIDSAHWLREFLERWDPAGVQTLAFSAKD
jgi:hypothetical protein